MFWTQKNFCTKIFLVLHFLDLKFFCTDIFGPPIFWTRIFLVPNFFCGPKIFLDPNSYIFKIFAQNVLDTNKFLHQNFSSLTFFGPYIFLYWYFWAPHFSGPESFWSQIFFDWIFLVKNLFGHNFFRQTIFLQYFLTYFFSSHFKIFWPQILLPIFFWTQFVFIIFFEGLNI